MLGGSEEILVWIERPENQEFQSQEESSVQFSQAETNSFPHCSFYDQALKELMSSHIGAGDLLV